ncbi:MAG: sugar ABC transporter permease [Clostridia bacterium]|nr:sugar ABC transporter permease [Clostridia bacterium]
MAKRSWTLKQTGYVFVAVMVLPTVISWLIFGLIPDVSAVAHAFMDDRTGAFTLDNFKNVFASLSDTTNGQSLFTDFRNTMRYFAHGIIRMPFSLTLTYFLFKRIKGHNIYRTIFLLPGIIPGLIWVTVYKEMTSMNGILGQICEALGTPMEQSLYKDGWTGTNALLVYGHWLGLAGGMLYYFSAMSRIPDSVFEAALLDGCGPGREAFQIVLPLIAPTVGTLFMLSVASMLSSSGPLLLFTKGQYGTSTLAFELYYRLLQDPTGGIGIVTAIGMLMTAVSLPIALGTRFLTQKFFPDIEY